MQYIIERTTGTAGFEKVSETITTEDGRYHSALEALRENVITPFNPDHKGHTVLFEELRPTLAIAKLPTSTSNFSDCWICTAIDAEEGFED